MEMMMTVPPGTQVSPGAPIGATLQGAPSTAASSFAAMLIQTISQPTAQTASNGPIGILNPGIPGVLPLKSDNTEEAHSIDELAAMIVRSLLDQLEADDGGAPLPELLQAWFAQAKELLAMQIPNSDADHTGGLPADTVTGSPADANAERKIVLERFMSELLNAGGNAVAGKLAASLLEAVKNVETISEAIVQHTANAQTSKPGAPAEPELQFAGHAESKPRQVSTHERAYNVSNHTNTIPIHRFSSFAEKADIVERYVYSDRSEALLRLSGSNVRYGDASVAAESTVDSDSGVALAGTAGMPLQDLKQPVIDHRVHAPELPKQAEMTARNFASEMSSFIVKELNMSQIGRFSEATISLIPEHLGKVDVRITMHHGQLTAQFVADTAIGKEMLEQQLPQLRAALQTQGLQVDKLEVAQQSSEHSNLFHDGRQHRPNQQHHWQRQNKSKSGAYDAVAAALSVETIARPSAYDYGGGFDVTA